MFRKIYKKGLCLLLALVLCMGCLGGLTGCSSGDTGNECGTDGSLTGVPVDGGSDGDGSGDSGSDGESGQEEANRPVRYGMELTQELETVNTHIGDVSWELFRQSMKSTAEKGESGMISPFSLLTALSMAQAGAAGETLAEMEQVFGWSAEEISAWLTAWNASLSDSDLTKVNVANSFWYRQSFLPSDDYLQSLETAFQAEFRPSEFDDSTAAEMNRWCNEETFGMIPKIVDQLDSNAEAMLLNAIAFEGKWQKEYKDHQIMEDEIFTAEDGSQQKVTLLSSQEDTYLSADGISGFLKPYVDGYSFVALLPEEGTPVSELVDRLDGDLFRQLLEESQQAQVNVYIPEFKSEYDAENIKEVLQSMGIKRIFSPSQADLTAMGQTAGGGSLYVSRVIHKTFIELNREGTRTAAVTGLLMKPTSAMPEELPHYEVRLDRPFIYVIIDDRSWTPLFIGITMSIE